MSDNMQIQGREVEALRYEGTPVMTAYVNQLSDDCRKRRNPEYQCMGNCENRIVIARFIEGVPISIKALVQEEMQLHPQVPELQSITDLAGLEKIARKPGYTLRDINMGKALSLYGQHVAVYNPCGFSIEPKLYSPDVNSIILELTSRADELDAIAKNVPLDALLLDPAFVNLLDQPSFHPLVVSFLGHRGADLITKYHKGKKADQQN